MIVDAHNHVGKSEGIYQQTVEQLLATMDENEIDRAVTFTYPQAIDNRYIGEIQRRNPDRIIGWALVNPWESDASEQLRRCVEKLELHGLKLHPFLNGYAIDCFEVTAPVLDVAAEYRLPVIVHTYTEGPYNTPFQVEEVARRYPDCSLLMAHSGFMWQCEQATRATARTPNLYLETSCVDAGEVRMFVETVGANRVVMGTDTPTGWFATELVKIRAVGRTEEERAAMLGGNLTAIINRQGP